MKPLQPNFLGSCCRGLLGYDCTWLISGAGSAALPCRTSRQGERGLVTPLVVDSVGTGNLRNRAGGPMVAIRRAAHAERTDGQEQKHTDGFHGCITSSRRLIATHSPIELRLGVTTRSAKMSQRFCFLSALKILSYFNGSRMEICKLLPINCLGNKSACSTFWGCERFPCQGL